MAFVPLLCCGKKGAALNLTPKSTKILEERHCVSAKHISSRDGAEEGFLEEEEGF